MEEKSKNVRPAGSGQSAPARYAVLKVIGDRGPRTAWAMSVRIDRSVCKNPRHVAAAACDDGLLTRAGYQGREVLYALTPDGVAWLDAYEAGRARKKAS